MMCPVCFLSMSLCVAYKSARNSMMGVSCTLDELKLEGKSIPSAHSIIQACEIHASTCADDYFAEGALHVVESYVRPVPQVPCFECIENCIVCLGLRWHSQ
jgi:hypothetical protein